MALTIGKVAKAATSMSRRSATTSAAAGSETTEEPLSLSTLPREHGAPGSVREARTDARLLAARDSRVALASSGPEGSMHRRETAGRHQAQGHPGEDPCAAGDASSVETAGLAVRRDAACFRMPDPRVAQR